MQIAVTRVDYVEVPDAVVIFVKAWIRNCDTENKHIPAVSIIKSIRESMKCGLKEAKDIYDACRTEVSKDYSRF